MTDFVLANGADPDEMPPYVIEGLEVIISKNL